MEIIPVIDIRKGRVVHAIKGQRQNYRPLETALCEGCSPEDIVQAFINLYPFKTIYIADLDAIEGQSNNQQVIETLQNKFQTINFWIDQGLSELTEVTNRPNRTHVIGSETNISSNSLNVKNTQKANIILSLDYQNNTFMGNHDLLQRTNLWPDKIIIMSLSRVGSNDGPDYALISNLKRMADDRNIYVAGGVRDDTDLKKLKDMGIHGVLIATALHTQKITIDTLNTFSKKNAP